ncbi:immunoglobulin-like domain-containing protein [Pedobacter sp. UC225_61]|uniref:immunoglobulin-like domain-containing protein n=1 Tax=Pedobacter sp. UC225_61 TaxID=3374623 RepID=UPI0037A2BB46
MTRKYLLPKLFCLLLTIAACSPNPGPQKADKKANDHPSATSGDKVSMTIEPNPIRIFSSGKAMLTLTNRSTDSIKLGDRFWIESFNAKKWKPLNNLDSMSFNDIGYIIPPGQAKQLPINLRLGTFHYPPGRYRICKLVQFIPGEGS